jgi:hypothetical protein
MKIGQETYPENNFKFKAIALISQEMFFIEYGQYGYQKNPLSMQISK